MFGPGLPCASRDPPRPDGQAFGAARAAAGARVRCALQGSHWLDLVAEHSRPGTRITTQQPAVARRAARVDTTLLLTQYHVRFLACIGILSGSECVCRMDVGTAFLGALAFFRAGRGVRAGNRVGSWRKKCGVAAGDQVRVKKIRVRGARGV
ncbi:hypothetical protein L1887_45983 [Cichorium endivia]|nr:hypothetical protein L1887_45983 [Cichorium endivia]